MAKPTIDELEQKIAEFEAANAELNTQIATANATKDVAEKSLADAQELIAYQSQQIAALETATAATNANENTLPTVSKVTAEVDGEEFYFRKETFIMVGDPKKHKAIEAAQDEALLKRIVAIKGQTILIKAD